MNSESPNKIFLKVLVADENLVDAQLAKIILSNSHNVSLENDGHSVVTLVINSIDTSSPFEIVLLNDGIRNLDSIEATRQLRTAGFTGAIIGTGFDLTPQLKQQWRMAGCNDFIQKPISFALLNSTIQRVALART